MSQHDKFEVFKELHQPGKPFIIPNPWDIGSARVLAALGAKALATTSAGFAFTIGKPDMGHVSRDEMLSHAENIVAATDLPVSADLENGFGHSPDEAAETVRRAFECGLAGCSIEDTKLPSPDAYDRELAIERVKACIAMVKSFAKPFMLTARADGFMNDVYGVEEAKARLLAFADLGADVLYAPLLPLPDSAEIASRTQTPINILAMGNLAEESMASIAKAGIARISIGSALSRITHKALLEAAMGLLNDHNFTLMTEGASSTQIDPLLEQGKKR